MKTREEFVASVEAYRAKTRRYAFFLAPLIALLIIGNILVLAVLSHLLGKHSPLLGIWILVFFLGVLGLNIFQAWYYKNLAKNCGLVCPECGRVVIGRDLKLVTATHN